MSRSSLATTVSLDLLRKYDRSGPRYTSYPTVPVWKEDVGPSQYEAALTAAAIRVDEPLAIYCHIPFCRKRCYYCGCNTVITNNASRVEGYANFIRHEIDTVTSHLGQRRNVSQLHFGGGTPTYLDPACFDRVLEKLSERFRFVDGAERSIEIDPRVTTEQHLAYLAQRGFNRVSLGVQDFDPRVQAAVGRIQSFEQVAGLIERCRALQFRGINIDLIYGLPLQSPETFANTLDLALRLRPDRIAVYSFAYLPKSMPHQSAIRAEELPTTETKYRLISMAIERFTGAGYRQIGMDHFALPEDELAVAQTDGRLHRNFMGYTVQSAPEMIGFGMSAIGYVDHTFFQTVSKLDSYENGIERDGLAIYRGLKLTDDDLIRQHLISALMCNFRLRFENLEAKFGVRFEEYFAEDATSLREFIEDGLLTLTPEEIQVTPQGRTFVRNIAMAFDAYLKDSGGPGTPTFSRTI